MTFARWAPSKSASDANLSNAMPERANPEPGGHGHRKRDELPVPGSHGPGSEQGHCDGHGQEEWAGGTGFVVLHAEIVGTTA